MITSKVDWLHYIISLCQIKKPSDILIYLFLHSGRVFKVTIWNHSHQSCFKVTLAFLLYKNLPLFHYACMRYERNGKLIWEPLFTLFEKKVYQHNRIVEQWIKWHTLVWKVLRRNKNTFCSTSRIKFSGNLFKMHTLYFPCVRKKVFQCDIIWDQWHRWQAIYLIHSGQHTMVILNYKKLIHIIYFP